MELVDEEYEPDDGYLEFRLWVCLGCDTCLMETIYNEGEPLAHSADYTPPRQLHGIIIKEFHRLPSQLTTIYQQVIHSFNHNLTILCAIGIRALLEGICDDKQTGGKNIFKKIENLKDHHLPPNIIQHLHTFRFIGNTAAHELDAPSQYTLKQCIEVLEDLLNYLYELEYKAARIHHSKK